MWLDKPVEFWGYKVQGANSKERGMYVPKLRGQPREAEKTGAALNSTGTMPVQRPVIPQTP